jgi:hypothetical protein
MNMDITLEVFVPYFLFMFCFDALVLFPNCSHTLNTHLAFSASALGGDGD